MNDSAVRDDIAQLDAAAMAAAFATRELSPLEVARAVLARIERWEPHINAMYRVHVELALAAADRAQARWARAEPLSALDGVPVTLKDNIDTQGDPTPLGTAATTLIERTSDAPPAARVREAGLTLLGKTTMPDYGMLSSGRSTVHGTTRNPWRADLNPSGSSSGAGAATAAGYGPLHVGTDIGGSIRLPAAHCGVFGLKPSLGRVPIDPPFLGRAAGPMTRTVRDAAMLLDVLSAPDVRDHMSLPPQRPGFAANLDSREPAGLRIGLLLDMPAGLSAQAPLRAAAQAAAEALEHAGARIEPISGFVTPAMLDGLCRFFEARSYNDIAALAPDIRARVLPYIVEWATHRAAGFSGAEVMAAFGQVMAMRAAASNALSGLDFIVSPVTPVVAYPADAHGPTDDPHRALEHIAFTCAWNFGEQPAASVPWCDDGAGLPIGVQVIGQRFDDLGVLQLSRILEQLRPAQRAWPTVPKA